MFTNKQCLPTRRSNQVCVKASSSRGQALDENWETVKVEANQLMTDLQATYEISCMRLRRSSIGGASATRNRGALCAALSVGAAGSRWSDYGFRDRAKSRKKCPVPHLWPGRWTKRAGPHVYLNKGESNMNEDI